jgi:glycogen(starch) synthase
MSRLYRESDVLVIPSWYEPFGMVVLEGMMNGIAIVAANTGGPAEILEHERTALLVPPRDAPALAAALARVLLDDNLRRRLVTAAARQVRRKWLWSSQVSLFRNVYADASRPVEHTISTGSGYVAA